ncbi:cytochrome P450 [Colletotrichum caudatum]|nr:cytochrome P450 [Colletotrichum caudatum]
MSGEVEIPEPPRIPVLGHVAGIDAEYSLGSFVHLANKYGPIYRLDLLGQKYVFVNNHELVNECCDDKRFKKCIDGDLEELREAVHDGLFTSKGVEEENWGVAHRVLMSAFGPLAIREMFDPMHDVAGQLAMKWARHGPSQPIHIGEDMTRLTMDTVALCTMGYRFNSYYREDTHPFITAMYAVMKEAGDKAFRMLPQVFYKKQDKKMRANIELLRSTAREVLEARRSDPNGAAGRKDVLTAMLNTVDPVTGRKMTDDSIIDNLITFLVAGHETTAATFTFTMYWLLKRPEVYRKVQEEVDLTVGDGPLRVEHVAKLKYLTAVIREVLRHSAPIYGFGRKVQKGEEVIGGKYRIKEGEQILCLLAKSHLDPKVYGDDAEEFKPERMLDENFDRLMKEFPNCWSPFGTGMRGCIGRAFAWQEMVLALALLMQNFNFVMHNPNYDLKISQTLTIKPKDFYIRAILREGLTPSTLEARLAGSFAAGGRGAQPETKARDEASKEPAEADGAKGGAKLAVLYGSNSGTCEFMAQRLASDAASHGFSATVDTLDTARESLPTDRPVVIITSSYEGEPPHNAALFVDWLANLKGRELENVDYAVYGCGHADWAKTYQRIPKLIDASIEERGGRRIIPIASTDAKDRDMFSDFEAWEDDALWPALAKQFGRRSGGTDGSVAEAGLSVSFSTPRTSTLRQDVRDALVIDSRPLVNGGHWPVKRHLEVQLPSNARYTAGDYMAVLPHNSKDTVARVMRRFHLSWDSHAVIKASGPTTLPTDVSTPVSDVLSSYVELCQTASRKNVSTLSRFVKDDEPRTKDQLQYLATDGYDAEVKNKKLSILDIAEQFPSLAVPFNHFLLMLPPMRVRQYSISSSPLLDPGVATITYGVLDEPALSGQGRHVGVTSSYLSGLAAGDRIQISIRVAQGGFKLPVDMDRTPLLCVAAGTGLAPFRAFVQERAILLSNGRQLAPAVLFFGCRDPLVDDLYREEFDKWEAAGVVKMYRAYSRNPDASGGCKYVQDRIWQEREMLYGLWDQGARVYVCGSNRVAEGVKDVLLRAAREKSEIDDGKPMTDEELEEWFNGIRNERYATDVFD